MSEKESLKVIDEWMIFVDDHVTIIQESKTKIRTHIHNLKSEELHEVAEILKETKGKIKEANSILKNIKTIRD